MSSNEETAVIFEKAKNGDEDAFKELASRFEPILRNRPIMRLSLESEDDIQDVFVTFLKSLRRGLRYEGDSQLMCWLTTVATRHIITKYHLRQRGPTTIQMPEEAPDQTDARQRDPAMEADDAARAELLKAAIEKLPKEHRTIIVLRAMEQYTFDEIARFLKVPRPTIWRRYQEAIALLRKWLTDWGY